MVLTNDKRSEIQKRENSRFVSPSVVHVFVAKTSEYIYCELPWYVHTRQTSLSSLKIWRGHILVDLMRIYSLMFISTSMCI